MFDLRRRWRDVDKEKAGVSQVGAREVEGRVKGESGDTGDMINEFTEIRGAN